MFGLFGGNNADPPRKASSEYYFDGNKLDDKKSPYQKIKGQMQLTIDKNSIYDNLRGKATNEFYLVDRFNKRHVFKIQDGDTINTFFPIQGSQIYICAPGIDNPGDQLRRSCDAAHTWCEAQFTNKGDCIRAAWVFMKDNNISSESLLEHPMAGNFESIKYGIYYIKSVRNKRYLNVETDGMPDKANVRTYGGPNEGDQPFASKWIVDMVDGKHSLPIYTIRSLISGRCLNVADVSKGSEANIQAYEDSQSEASQWIIEEKQGICTIKNVCTSKNMYVNGVNVQCYNNPEDKDCHWTFVCISPWKQHKPSADQKGIFEISDNKTTGISKAHNPFKTYVSYFANAFPIEASIFSYYTVLMFITSIGFSGEKACSLDDRIVRWFAFGLFLSIPTICEIYACACLNPAELVAKIIILAVLMVTADLKPFSCYIDDTSGYQIGVIVFGTFCFLLHKIITSTKCERRRPVEKEPLLIK